MALYTVFKRVICPAATPAFTTARILTVKEDGVTLKRAEIWFPSGAAEVLQFRILKGDQIFLPDQDQLFAEDPSTKPPLGDAFVGDNHVWKLYVGKMLRKGEQLKLQFLNTDAVDEHTVGVMFEILPREAPRLNTIKQRR